MRTLPTALAGLLLISTAGAHEFKTGSITVEHPWARPAAAGNSAAYFVLENEGAADRLVGVSSDVAGSVEMHSTTIDAQGVGRMVPVQAVDVPRRGRGEVCAGRPARHAHRPDQATR